MTASDQRWSSAVSAARNFARSPLPTLAVWVGDALSGLTLDLWGRAIEWRIARQLSEHTRLRAAGDLGLIAAFVIVAAWVL